MSELSSLLLFVLPVSLLAAVSPIVFLNASTVLTNFGQRGARQFLGGNALVLSFIGLVTLGVLGEGIAALAEDELASRIVEVILGALLFGYGVVLWRSYLRSRAPESPEQDQLHHARRHGLFAFGMLGMATNYTTLPLYVAAGQRIGVAPIGLVWRVLLLALVTVIVLAPAWLPMMAVRVSPGGGRLSPKTRSRIASGTRLATIIACFVGGTLLMLRAVL